MAREIVEVITPSTTDDLPEGSTNKYDTGAPPVSTDDLTEGSTNLYEQGDMTGAEIQTAVLGLADADRVLVGSEPQPGEKKVYGIHRNASGNLELDAEDTAEV